MAGSTSPFLREIVPVTGFLLVRRWFFEECLDQSPRVPGKQGQDHGKLFSVLVGREHEMCEGAKIKSQVTETGSDLDQP